MIAGKSVTITSGACKGIENQIENLNPETGEMRLRYKLPRGKQVAVGDTFEVHLFDYEIACAELCGTGHYTMRGIMRVVTPEQFEAWKKNRYDKYFDPMTYKQEKNWGWKWVY